MTTSRNPSRRAATYAKAALSALAGLLVFWACHLNETDGAVKFNLVPDSAWADCDSLLVELHDTTGETIDTLFYDALESLDQLKSLDASSYKGGRAGVRVVSWNADGSVCAEQTRTFDDKKGDVVVDTVSLPGAQPKSVTLEPSSLELMVGDPAATVKASIEPKFADQVFEWSVEDYSVAALDYPDGPESREALVIPLKNGATKIKVKSKKDPSKSAEITVRVGSVGGRAISILPDSLTLYLGGPDSAFKATTAPEAKDGEIKWTSSNETVAKVDAEGGVHGLKEGAATIQAKYGEASAFAEVRVKRDAPYLTVTGKPGAAVNSPIVFSPKVTQEFGSIVMFKFDLDGDDDWDDSLPGPFLGANVDLPAQTASFAKEGAYKVRFLVRDSEGNEASATLSVDIGNQAPETVSKSNDTLVSINDLVVLEARVRDAEGKVTLVGWDYNGDGKLEDSVTADDSAASIKGGRRYANPGKHVAFLYATDDAGKTGVDSVRIAVVLDPPEADMGADVEVIAGSPVAFSVKGKDKFGAIAKREIRIGSGSFINLGKQDTSIIVPGDTGKVQVIGRVTDDDGVSDEDTMVVTLRPPSTQNNDLSSLVASAGTLTPVFKPVTLAYSLAVGFADSSVSVTALTTDPLAGLMINDVPTVSGTASDPVTVKVGTTPSVFRIVVTAQDGGQKTYIVAVTRAPSNDASLAKLEPAGFTLKPSFKPEVFDYADTVAFKTASVGIKPTAAHPAAKVTVNDTVVSSGSASGALPLEVGDNLIRINVTAQDGKTKSAYTVKLVRRAKVIVSRTVGPATTAIDSLEAPLGTIVGLKAPDTIGFHFEKWSLTEGTGTFQDSAANPAKLTVKSATVRVKAAFAVNVYLITGTVSGFNGGVFDHDTVRVEHGKDTVITVTPLVGQRVLAVTDSGKEIAPTIKEPIFGAKTYKFTKVTKHHPLVAKFFKTYTLTSSVTSGLGTISPAGTAEVDSGSSQGFTLTSGSPSTGVWVSAFTDNGVSVVDSLSGDRMKVATYKLVDIKANHTIAATFDIRTYRMIVSGVDLCIQKVVSCPVGQICAIRLCLDGTGPSLDTIVGTHGSTYTINTDSANSCYVFSQWNKDGAAFSAERYITTSPLTADVTYTAAYKCATKLCCGIIIDPIDPPILEPIPMGAISPAPPQSREPEPVGP